MTDWMTERAREAADAWEREWEHCYGSHKALVHAFATLATEAYARGCADQHERTKAAAVDVATERAEAWAMCEREASECRAVAAAIKKMEMKDD